MLDKILMYAKAGILFAGKLMDWYKSSTSVSGHEGEQISEEEIAQIGVCFADAVMDVFGIKLGVLTYIEGQLTQERYDELRHILDMELQHHDPEGPGVK